MKLMKQTPDGWEYRLNQKETDSLCFLVSQFPVVPPSRARISRTDSDPKSDEREKLLNESLAEHRRDLKKKARHLVDPDKFKLLKKNRVFRVGTEDREILLQILNDIRVESWRILGEPENLEIDPLQLSHESLRHYHYMHLAGYFEHHLIVS